MGVLGRRERQHTGRICSWPQGKTRAAIRSPADHDSYSARHTQGLGLTYQQRNFDLGIFQKRIGPMWNDNKSYHNQVAIDPFTMVNLFLNYTIRNNTRFDQTKIGLSFNNLLNSENTIGVTPANAAVPVSIGGVNSTYLANTTPAGGDLLTLTPGRSVMLSVTFGLQRNR